MNFRSLNRLNVLANTISANFLPMTTEKTKLSVPSKIYWIAVWSITLTYTFTCIGGIVVAPWDRVLKDSALTTLVCLEVVVLHVYLKFSNNALHELIGKLNRLLDANNQISRNVTIDTFKPLERPLTVYIVISFAALVLWTSSPLADVFLKSEFHYTDYRVTAIVCGREPFSVGVFLLGVLLQNIGGAFTMIRKIGLDLYTMHLIRLTTAQYRYLRIKVTMAIREEGSNNLDGGTTRCDNSPEGKKVKDEIGLLMRHSEAVIEVSIMLKKLLSPNVTILYINNVLRFSFLSVMFVTSSAMYSEKLLIIIYATGQLIQFYIMCYCIQQLLDASKTVTDDLISEKWYFYSTSLQRAIFIMMFVTKLECRLSSFQNIDLTLPSFMSILNQAYSVCLLFLKVRSD